MPSKKMKPFSTGHLIKTLVKEGVTRATKSGMAGKAGKSLRDRKKTISRGVRVPGAKHRND